jgi:hypothetical protein
MSDMEQSADTQNSEATVSEADNEVIDNETEQSTGEDSQEQTEAEEEAELDVDGAKLKVPKSVAEKLKAERLMHQDYTRKTQELAEERKALAAAREQRQQEDTSDFNERSRAHQIAETLRQYEQVDWQAAWDQDPIAAGKAQAQIQAMLNEKTRLEGSIAQRQQHRAMSEQQEIAKQVQEAEAYVQREIPGWTEKRGEELKQFAASQGMEMTQDTARLLIKNPALLKIMHKAALFDQMEKKQTAKAPPPAPPAKPITRIGSKAPTGQVDPNKLSAEEWREWRERDLANKRKR